MATMKASERNKLPDSAFGIPSKRAYPLYKLDGDKLVPDKAHIESAVKLFGHASNEDKQQLAKNILKAAHKADMDTSGWNEVNKWANHEGATKKNAAEKDVTESALSFDIAMAVADLVLEYNEILYDEFYDAVYTDDETFLEQFEEPDDVQEAVPGLWEDYLRQNMPSYDPKTHTVRKALTTTKFRDPETGELITRPEFEDRYGLDSDIDSARVVIPEKRASAPWPKANSKEMNRRNAFLKRHKFDPKTGTIEIDEIDPATGQKMRIPVTFTVGGNDDMGTSNVAFQSGDDIPLTPIMRMNLGGTGLTQKAAVTEPILGHETAHANQSNMLRKLSRQFSHHRKIDDLFAAANQAQAKGNARKAQQYADAAIKYYNDNIDAVRAETDAIKKSLSLGSSQGFMDSAATDRLLQQDASYQRAVDNSQKYSQFLDSLHDSKPYELHADDYGEELASRYTRGRRTGAESLKLLESPKDRAKRLKELRKKIDESQHSTIEKSSSPTSRYYTAIEEINNNPKMQLLRHYREIVWYPEDGGDIDVAKAKIAELKADPEVQELLAKLEDLRKEYEKVPEHKRDYVDRSERVPNPEYADVDLSTISDDELIDRFNPKIRSNEKRVEIAKQVAAEKAARDLANQQYRRKLSRDALQTQLDSGKLTPQQEKKARQKIASIDAFERKVQSAENGTPITTKPKKKKTSESKKSQDSKEQTKKQETKQTEKKSEPEKKQEPAKKPTQKKDELPVQPAAKKDSMTIGDQKEPKK